MNNEALLRKLFTNSQQPVTFSDMEESIMHRIHKEKLKEQVSLRDKKLSFLFFLAGTTLGIILNSFLQKIPPVFPAIPAGLPILVFQLVFALFFLIKLESFLKLFNRKKITG